MSVYRVYSRSGVLKYSEYNYINDGIVNIVKIRTEGYYYLSFGSSVPHACVSLMVSFLFGMLNRIIREVSILNNK